MSEILTLSTSNRDALFNLCAILARGMDDKVLQDPAHPVLVTVNGGFECGKKIFADAMRRTLMSTASGLAFKGVLETEELWYANRNNHPIEVDFGNINRLEFNRSAAQDFMAQRKYGGVAFLHNTDKNANLAVSLDIWMDKKDSGLKDAFSASHKKNKWARDIKIDVRDMRLLTSASFQAALAAIRAGEHEKKPNAYGVDISAKSYVMEKKALYSAKFRK